MVNYRQRIKRRGLTHQQYMSMYLAVDGKCEICEKDIAYHRACIDHCHTSGKVRGLLCVPCNTAIGGMQEDVNILRAAISYLEKHNGHKGAK